MPASADPRFLPIANSFGYNTWDEQIEVERWGMGLITAVTVKKERALGVDVY
jgi:hypothetical protein